MPAVGRRRLGDRDDGPLGHGLPVRGRGLAVSAGRRRASNPRVRVARVLRDLRVALALAAATAAGRHDLLLVSRPRVRRAVSDRVPARQPGRRGRPHRGADRESRPRRIRRGAAGCPAAMANRRGLKIALATAAVGVAAVVGLAALHRRTPGLAPDFAVPDLSGQAVRLSGLRGQVVLLNLWTTWCPPCREEMPSMEKLYQRLKDRGFVLLAVSQDEAGKAAVAPFVRDLGLTFPVLVGREHQVGDRFNVWGYPESFIIDREGRVVERVIGPRDWVAPEQVAALERLLEAPIGQSAAADGGG